MLVRFDSKAGTITMFGDVAAKLLRMMGQTGSIPGALLAADIPAATARLSTEVQALQRGTNASRFLEPREVPGSGNDNQERAR